MADWKRTTLAAFALALSLASPAQAQEARAYNFGTKFRWCNGSVIDFILTSDQLAARGLPIPLTIVGAGLGWTPNPGPWPTTGDAMMAVDVGTAYYNAAKLSPAALQNGPLDHLNLLTYIIISWNQQPMNDVREFRYPIILRAGDALLLSYNCTGDPGNYTIGVQFGWDIKYLAP